MEISVVEELRLPAFKSFRGGTAAISDVTLLIGRNGSGKSNVLDALEVMTRLATGEDIRDALDGGSRDMGPVRGGVEGCAPRGTSEFSLGCSVRTGGELVTLDVTVQTEPHVQVVREVLTGPTQSGRRDLLHMSDPDLDRADVFATWWNGKRGPDPSVAMRGSRLLTSQVSTRVPATTAAGRTVHRAAAQVLAALHGVFHLDPVPHLMRQYVPERDVNLRRNAENLSASLRDLKTHDPETFDELLRLLRDLPEHQVNDLVVERSGLGDVMLALAEAQGNAEVVISARGMSDGMLRFLAIATALLTAADSTEEPLTDSDAVGGRTLVVEELENGLHPSQAARILDMLVRASRPVAAQTLATTHSPALLSALPGESHDHVLVCDRDRTTGFSRLRGLPQVPGYARAMASGDLGQVITKNRLEGEQGPDYGELDRLLGIS